jgi:crossover junction endodeoxyribonuclease RusA
MRMGGRVCRSPKAQEYSKEAFYTLKSQNLTPLNVEKYHLTLFVSPPDKRKHDLDNVCKGILDALQAAGFFDDDYQVWRLDLERCNITPGGKVAFILKEYFNNAQI